MLKNDLFLRAARRERTERTPVWLMRQAGRTDPAYRALRERANLPLEAFFRDSDLAAETSLLPKRLGVDAIILFTDILTPLAPMGAPFVFRPGPRLERPWRGPADVGSLCKLDPASDLPFVGRALRSIREALNDELPVLGFAGAPLTLAFFLLEGESPGENPTRTRAFMADDPAGFHRLLDMLADMTIDYLAYQCEQGADAVQLFESMADLVSAAEYEAFAHPYHVKIFSALAGRAPTILFARERRELDLMVSSGADVLSVGRCVDLAEAKRRYGDRVAFQGNVDNTLVATGSLTDIDDAVRACLEAGEQEGHILNLSHGLLKDTPLSSVRRVIDTAKRTRVPTASRPTTVV